MMQAHRFSNIDDTAQIGDGTIIHAFASVIRYAVLGENCSVATGACLDGCKFGNNVRIGHNVAMGPGFLIGNDVFIGPNVVFCNDAFPRAHKTGFKVARLLNQDEFSVIVEDGASIGANATILPGVRIGSKAMIAAGAVVTKDVPPNYIHFRDGSMREIGNEANISRIRYCK